MKKDGILNSEISTVLSFMRHTDLICISDCGLPAPEGVKVIDLAISENFPAFISVVENILDHYKYEKAFIAKEIKDNNPKNYDAIKNKLKITNICEISHEDFKKKLINCKAIIRTGEMTPYSNIIFQSACLF